MKTEVTITVEKRALDTKPKHLREQGYILGVIYGHGFESTPIKFEYQAFRKAYKITGDSTVLNVSFEGKEVSTLVHSVDYDPLSDDYIHVDFLAVNDDEPVKATIPLVLEGLAPAVKNLTAVLVSPYKAIEVECLPKHLVKEIIVDVTGLENFHDTIHVSDLEISSSKDITVLTAGDSVVVTANPPKGGVKKDDTDNNEENPADEKAEA